MQHSTSEARANGLRELPAYVLKQARRLIVLVIGASVLLLGLILIVTPGPAFVVVPVGLAILGLEFVWARRLMRRVKTTFQESVMRNWSGHPAGPDATDSSGETKPGAE